MGQETKILLNQNALIEQEKIQRLATKYRNEFLTAKAKLEDTQGKLEQSKLRELDLEKNVSSLQDNLKKWETKLEDEHKKRNEEKEIAEQRIQETKILLNQASKEQDRIHNEWRTIVEKERQIAEEHIAKLKQENIDLSREAFEMLEKEQ